MLGGDLRREWSWDLGEPCFYCNKKKSFVMFVQFFLVNTKFRIFCYVADDVALPV